MSRSVQMPPPPPLLLTKRVTSFLRANLSTHINSAMLTTPAGSLLAHASNLPASALRRQAAVAASLWALQGPGPGPAPPPTAGTIRSRKSKSTKHSPPTVTVQLDTGAVFVIRRLRCGMLFICTGGTETPPVAPPSPHITRLSRSPAPGAAPDEPPTAPSPPPPPPQSTTTLSTAAPPPPAAAASEDFPHGSPSESASILSSHTLGAASTTSTATVSGGSVSLMRRHVEELARWLDERLGGLCVPEEGIGIFSVGSGNGGGVEVR